MNIRYYPIIYTATRGLDYDLWLSPPNVNDIAVDICRRCMADDLYGESHLIKRLYVKTPEFLMWGVSISNSMMIALDPYYYTDAFDRPIRGFYGAYIPLDSDIDMPQTLPLDFDEGLPFTQNMLFEPFVKPHWTVDSRDDLKLTAPIQNLTLSDDDVPSQDVSEWDSSLGFPPPGNYHVLPSQSDESLNSFIHHFIRSRENVGIVTGVENPTQANDLANLFNIQFIELIEKPEVEIESKETPPDEPEDKNEIVKEKVDIRYYPLIYTATRGLDYDLWLSPPNVNNVAVDICRRCMADDLYGKSHKIKRLYVKTPEFLMWGVSINNSMMIDLDTDYYTDAVDRPIRGFYGAYIPLDSDFDIPQTLPLDFDEGLPFTQNMLFEPFVMPYWTVDSRDDLKLTAPVQHLTLDDDGCPQQDDSERDFSPGFPPPGNYHVLPSQSDESLNNFIHHFIRSRENVGIVTGVENPTQANDLAKLFNIQFIELDKAPEDSLIEIEPEPDSDDGSQECDETDNSSNAEDEPKEDPKANSETWFSKIQSALYSIGLFWMSPNQNARQEKPPQNFQQKLSRSEQKPFIPSRAETPSNPALENRPDSPFTEDYASNPDLLNNRFLPNNDSDENDPF